MINSEYTKNDAGVVVNNNLSEYELYKQRRNQVIEKKTLESKVDFLEKEILDLKSRLYNIENRLT